MLKGEVVFFHDKGGYGFIEVDSGDYEEDVFVHMSSVDGPDLEEGETVSFEVEESEKGFKATNVQRPNGGEAEESEEDEESEE